MPKILKERDDTAQAGSVLEDRWSIAICLGAIFILAFFMRTYFAFELSTKFGTPFLLTGGSDSYYYEKIVEYLAFNHHHLLHDSMLNYPLGRANPRPPLYSWSVSLTGHIFAPLVGDLTRSVHYSLILSTSFWGAMTIFPVYLVGRDIFGKKAGITAAFLLAISAGHLQRSPIGNADHDAFYLFFAVTGFYFLMKALKYIPEDRTWVKDWRDRGDIKSGLSTFISENKRSLLYSAMAGVSIGAVALTWQGYAYVFVIILVYYFIQLFLDKFRYRDSLGVTACVGITVVLGILIAAPYYMGTGSGHSLPHGVGTWFDVPLIMVTIAMIGGTIITVSRDYPWVLVFSILSALAAGILLYAAYFSPALMNTFTSGAGYFVRTKLYDTIAEAQAPEFSNLVFSFGPATFFLSIAGIALAIWYIRDKWTTNFLFVLVWAAFSIYMATSAARFIFNAAPAFALMAGWLVALGADKAEFGTLYRRLKGARAGFFTRIKRGVKVGHIVAVLSIAFLIVMPNVFYGFDAGIPFDTKSEYDEQVNQALPELLRPEDYDENQQQVWHLGAFGFGIDKPTDYWPAAWEWLKEENSDIPPEERPAFLSWWDYGFEAVQRAQHPTVADNFQTGYRFAGNALMAQNESELLSLLIARTVQAPIRDDGGISGDVRDILVRHIGEEKTDLVEDAFLNPADYQDEVLSNPDRYHPRADDIDNGNVRWARLMGLLSYEERDTLVELYYELTEELETLIKYIGIDTRLFPFDARQTGVFYAPALLSGHRVGGNSMARTPVDFYTIAYVDMQGNEYEDPDEIPPGAEIVDFKINFKQAFYDTVLYRTFAGISGAEAGKEQGIPTVDVEDIQPMPAWGMENFKLATRTAYWNPYPEEEVRDHPEAWRAVSLQDAIKHQEEEKGIADMSGQSYMRQGVVFIEYFHGALVSGSVTTSDGQPVSDARVTIIDEMGTPHQVTYTDEDGRYETKAPAGDISLVVSTGGDLEPTTKTESVHLGIEQFHVTHEQAMRREVDRTGDGRWDYLIRKDIEAKTGDLSANVFVDKDDSGDYTPTNDTLVESTITLSGTGVEIEVETDGSYDFTGLVPGKYTLSSDAPGTTSADVMIEPEEQVTEDIKVQAASLEGQALMEDTEIKAIELYLEHAETGDRYVEQVDPGGNYTFSYLLPGDYVLGIEQDEYAVYAGPKVLELTPGAQKEMNVTFTYAYIIEGVAETVDGLRLAHQRLSLTGILGRTYSHMVITDDQGEFDVKIPIGDYTVYGTHRKDGEKTVHLGTISVPEDTEHTARFGKGHGITANVELNDVPVEGFNMEFVTLEGTIMEARSNAEGRISLFLPENFYSIYGWKRTVPDDLYYRTGLSLDRDRTISVAPLPGHPVEGQIYRDLNFDGEYGEGEDISARIQVEVNGHSISLLSSSTGQFEAVLPNEEVLIKLTKEGFHDEDISYHPEDEFGPYLAMETKDVQVHGDFTLDDGESYDFPITFEAVDEGAVDTETSVVDGEYEVYLQPGVYDVIVDSSPEDGIRYSLEKRINIEPTDEPLELSLEANHTVRIHGMISDEDGEEVPATLSFKGIWEKELVADDGIYELYLPTNTYSMWCADMEGELVATDKLTITGPMEYNITLDSAVEFSPLVTYDGESREGIVMTLENMLSGYRITRTTDEDGTFSVNLAQGEYEVGVDYLTTEPIDGILRDVRFMYSDVYDLTVSTSPHISLERELVHSNLSGRVYLDGKGVPHATINFIEQTPEAISTSTETMDDGTFSLPLSKGTYSIYVEYQGRTRPYSAFKTFVMGDVDDVLNVTLDPAFKLTGTVRRDGAATQAEINIVDLEKLMELEEVSKEDGLYTLVLPKGVYQIRAETSFTHDELGEITYMDEQEIDLTYNTRTDLDLSMVKEYGIEVDSISAQEAKPGDTIDYNINIENTGNTYDEFRLSASPGAIWDMGFSPSTFSLGPDESRNVQVSLHLPDDAIVNHPPISFIVESLNSDETASKTLPADVEQDYGVEMLPTVSKRTIRDGQIIYTIGIENTGNGRDTFDLLVQNKGHLESLGWGVSLDEDTGEVSEDVVSEVELVLTPRSHASSDLTVQIKATSQGYPSVEDSVVYDIELPTLSADKDSFRIDGEGILLEAATFEMRTSYWVLLIIAATVGAVYYIRKKRWF
ncbi:MAG: carboxypeptidase regulatory-like domain-containing protein [Thermoplasmata archaeon]